MLRSSGLVSGLGRAGLEEGPAMALEVLGFVRTEAVLMDLLDDPGAVLLAVREVRVEVVDVHPGGMIRGRRARFGSFEEDDRAGSGVELDPARLAAFVGDAVPRLQAEDGVQPACRGGGIVVRQGD